MVVDSPPPGVELENFLRVVDTKPGLTYFARDASSKNTFDISSLASAQLDWAGREIDMIRRDTPSQAHVVYIFLHLVHLRIRTTVEIDFLPQEQDPTNITASDVEVILAEASHKRLMDVFRAMASALGRTEGGVMSALDNDGPTSATFSDGVRKQLKQIFCDRHAAGELN